MEDHRQNPYLFVKKARACLQLQKRTLDDLRRTGIGPL